MKYLKKISADTILLGAIGSYLILSAVLIAVALSMTNGRHVYPLDDSYIHMAMAKNLVEHGVWGLTRDGFSGSTSSPLWVLLLSIGYAIFGVGTTLPLFLNLLSGVALLVLLSSFIDRERTPSWTITIFYGIFILAVPLPVLGLIGMEHTLQLLVDLAYIKVLIDRFRRDNDPLFDWRLIVLAGLVTTIRYEGLLLVAASSILLFIRRRRFVAFTTIFLGIIPVLGYGIWSKLNGWFLLPVSVILRGNFTVLSAQPDGQFAEMRFLKTFGDCPELLVLIFAIILLITILNKRKSRKGGLRFGLILFLSVVILHIEFASYGWLYRYEAYLVGLGLVLIGQTLFDLYPGLNIVLLWRNNRKKTLLATLFLFIAAAPFFARGITATIQFPRSTMNIADQHLQIADFLKHYYKRASVVANDIGLVCFHADIDLFDGWGLASKEVASLKMQQKYSLSDVRKIAERKKSSIAAVNPNWFKEFGGPPDEWVWVGSWTIADNVIAQDPTIVFYAISESAKKPLVENLVAFEPRLARTVKVRYNRELRSSFEQSR